MSIGKLIAWGFSALLIFIPFNWIRMWAMNEFPPNTSLSESIIGAAILWTLGGGLAYTLLWWGKRKKAAKAKEDQILEELLAAPLTEIRPRQALIKSDEKAYASIQATLKEEKTIGYSAGTRGASIRVAKGLTLRTSGTRAMPIKGMVDVAIGELVITDRRVIFAGDRKSFAITNADMLNTTNYTDGFGFTDGSKTYTLTTSGGHERMFFAVALHKVLRT